MKKNKLRLLAISLTSFTIIAGMAAYFSGKDEVTNTLEAATLQIRVVEPSWENNPIIVPEQKIDKDPYILNTNTTPAYVFMKVTVPAQEITLEDNDENKGKVITTATEQDAQTITYQTHTVPLFRFVDIDGSYTIEQLSTEQQYNDGWYFLESNEIRNGSDEITGYTYVYAYTGENTESTMAVLKPGEQTSTPLFNKVIFCNAREDDDLSDSTQHIQIEALGIQADYLKSSDETETEAEVIWQYLTR